jgi:hypothetical protein
MVKHCHKSGNSLGEQYLQQAAQSIHSVVCGIDTSLAQQDRGRRLMQLRAAFNVSPLISQDSPGRALVRCGELRKLCRTGLRRKLRGCVSCLLYVYASVPVLPLACAC